MRHLDLFSGIGGFALAAKWTWGEEYENVGHSEVEKFPCRVYHKHFPESECLGDITKIKWKEGQADIITGGFPCQNLSVAGKRQGLAGSESGLFWELARTIGEVKPLWFIVENVPGLQSANDRKDFWTVIATLEQFGYCVAWRILDAQYFGVAQKRRRMWIVGSLGNTGSAEVLFEPEGDQGNDTPKQAVGERGLCISTRNGVRQDPTTETTLAQTIQAKRGYRDNVDTPIIAHSTGTTDFTGATGSRSRNIIGYTLTSSPRGCARKLHEENRIATIDSVGERKIDGLPRGLDSVRGAGLGNAVVPQCPQVIMERIKLHAPMGLNRRRK
jgi:DNA (cytosine-5)-methyltransferase 1